MPDRSGRIRLFANEEVLRSDEGKGAPEVGWSRASGPIDQRVAGGGPGDEAVADAAEGLGVVAQHHLGPAHGLGQCVPAVAAVGQGALDQRVDPPGLDRLKRGKRGGGTRLEHRGRQADDLIGSGVEIDHAGLAAGQDEELVLGNLTPKEFTQQSRQNRKVA